MTRPDLPAHVLHPTVIGIIGRAGSGKTTAGNWFLRNHKQVLKMSFAAPVKAVVHALLNEVTPRKIEFAPSWYIHTAKDEPIPYLGGITARRLLQTIGTEWGRNTIHPDFWVGIAAAKLERRMQSSFGKHNDTTLRAVFDDVRFANEAEMIRAAGGCILRIVRPEDGRPPETYGHASEQQEIDADLTIVNDQDEENLFRILAYNWPPTAHLPPKPRPEPKKRHRP
jgi:hypothetical protein